MSGSDMSRVRRYDDWGRLKKKFRSGKSAEDRKAREQAALARLHGTVRFCAIVSALTPVVTFASMACTYGDHGVT